MSKMSQPQPPKQVVAPTQAPPPKKELTSTNPELHRDVMQLITQNCGDSTHQWFRQTLTHSLLAPWTYHPWEKFVAAERAAEKLYSDPQYVSRVLEYYSASLDKSTHLMAKSVVAHATFDAMNTIIHGRGT